MACGNHQDRDLYDEEDLSSPTMSLESIFILISFAAQWNAHIATADITGAYLKSSLEPNDIVYTFLSKDSVDQLKKLDPKIIKHIMADGRALVRLLKALYGTIQAAKLWYRKLKEITTSYGFCQHPHDQPQDSVEILSSLNLVSSNFGNCISKDAFIDWFIKYVYSSDLIFIFIFMIIF